jgi:hypothetical protein
MTTIKLNTLRSGFDFKTCWVAPMMTISADHSLRVLSMGKLDLSGSDVFEGTYCSYSKDQGKTWSEPTRPDVFARKPNRFGGTTCYEIFTKRLAKNGQIIGFGQAVQYTPDNRVDHRHPRANAVFFLNQDTLQWSAPIELEIPPAIQKDFTQLGFQVVDMANGDLLLPMATTCLPNYLSKVHVVRLRIADGQVRTIDYGAALDQVRQPRGLYEPSLIQFRGNYYLTLRNDITGYVAASEDGLNYQAPRPWCFDNGELLGNYNTQQRWVRNGDDELYLIYTRRNANNENVFRHRGPVMIAQVDPHRLCVIRETEQIVVPNRGARMGNFMATEIAPRRSWFTVAEWMQNDLKGYGRAGAEYCAGFGSDNSVFLADITWP